MATRHLLHISKLNDFKFWLKNQGYVILPNSQNPFEVLRAKKEKDTIIIYKKIEAKEHLSVQDKDVKIVKRFISQKKENMNA